MIYLTDLNKFAKYNQIYIGSLVILLFSLAGIPPLAGFLGKYYLFLSGFEQNYYLLVITGLVTSLVSGYYYLNIIKIMLFDLTYTQTNLNLYQKNFKFNTKYKMYNNVFTNAIFFFCEIILIIFIITHNSYFNVIINTTLSCLYPLSITDNTLIIDSL
jgi:NADH:ubiquinone oxidoreductase subunit 2 (subunit N)